MCVNDYEVIVNRKRPPRLQLGLSAEFIFHPVAIVGNYFTGT